jgi:hypothetical protein
MIQGLVFVDQIKKELPPRRFTQTVNRSIETMDTGSGPGQGNQTSVRTEWFRAPGLPSY